MLSKSILIAGVGGQGTLLAGKIVGNAALKAGYDVKVSEVHGMSQRGGSVVTYVKYGAKVASPIICRGEADIILAFEQMEALRWAAYLKCGGTLIMSTHKIKPMPVITGAAKYNENISEKLTATGFNVKTIDAFGIARAAGSEKAANIAVIGALAQYLEPDGITRGTLTEVIAALVPEKLLAVNIGAFERAAAI